MIDLKHIDDIRATWEKWKKLDRELRQFKKNRVFNPIAVSSVYGALTAIGIQDDAKLFVILYLFTPEALVGVKMRRGYRDFISSLFGYNNSCGISVRMKRLMMGYKRYKDFRADADRGIETAEKVLDNIKK